MRGFLASKASPSRSSYSQRIRQGCNLLTDAINATQDSVARAKVETDKKLEQLRQSVHEATAPKPPPAQPAQNRQRQRPCAETEETQAAPRLEPPGNTELEHRDLSPRAENGRSPRGCGHPRSLASTTAQRKRRPGCGARINSTTLSLLLRLSSPHAFVVMVRFGLTRRTQRLNTCLPSDSFALMIPQGVRDLDRAQPFKQFGPHLANGKNFPGLLRQ